MTPPNVPNFGQRVADALWESVPAVVGPGPTLEEIVRDWLAPRVSAALDAGLGNTWSSPAFRREAEDACIRKLRGQV
jgi:hypothetical protein